MIAREGAPRLDKYLAEEFGEFSRSFLEKAIAEGRVTIDGKPAAKGMRPRVGSRIALLLEEPQTLEVEPEDIPLDIVYQDRDLVVVNKGKDMVVHPAPGHERGTLVNALLYHVKDLSGINGVLRPGIVHRLDKDTTGLLVVAKNDAAHLSLAEQIEKKTARRAYQALVYGRLKQEEGTVDAPLGRHKTDRKRMAVTQDGGRPAVSHYRVMRNYDKYTLVEVRLETGRTHQIRVHMAYIGHPVVGDPVYSRAKCPFDTQGQMLHAGELGLNHPRTGERMTFFAPLPDYFQKILEKLEK